MVQDKNLQQAILDNLKRLPGGDTDALTSLFSGNLNYDYENDPVPTRSWSKSALDKLDSARFQASHRDFKVIWVRLKTDRLNRVDERPIINSVNKEYPYNLIVFSNSNNTLWDFVNVKLVTGQESEDNTLPERRRIVRRISVTEPSRLRTAAERLAMLAVDTDRQPLELQQCHDDAFDVEKVTKEFYTLIAVAFTSLTGGEREVKSIKAIINRLNLHSSLFGID